MCGVLSPYPRGVLWLGIEVQCAEEEDMASWQISEG